MAGFLKKFLKSSSKTDTIEIYLFETKEASAQFGRRSSGASTTAGRYLIFHSSMRFNRDINEEYAEEANKRKTNLVEEIKRLIQKIEE